MRLGVLALARHTGWAAAEIGAMTVSRFRWWLDGLAEINKEGQRRGKSKPKT